MFPQEPVPASPSYLPMDTTPDFPEDSNTSTPIRRLPDELLQVIFCSLAHNHAVAVVPSYRWLVVLYVCRHWTHLALSTDRLWSHIGFQDNSAATYARAYAFLLRSRMADLHVVVSHPPNTGTLSGDAAGKIALMLKPHVSRIRSLRISISAWEPKLALILTVAAPRLHSLTIDTRGFLRSIFSDNAPALRMLDITNVAIPWTSSILSNLTDLRLKSIQHAPTFRQLLDILALSPKLQSLSLLSGRLYSYNSGLPYTEYPIFKDLPSEHRLSHPVMLTCLRQLYLGSEQPEHLSRILTHLSFPTDASVTLRFFGDTPRSFTIPVESRELMQMMRDVHALHIGFKYKYHIWGASTEAEGRYEIEFSGHSAKSQSHLRLIWSFYDIIYPAALTPSEGLLPILGHDVCVYPNARHLTVHSTMDWLPVEDWRYVLGQLPALTTLEVTCEYEGFRAVYTALAPLPSVGLVVCPQLVRVRTMVNRTVVESAHEAVEYVMGALNLRADAGYPVQTALEFRPIPGVVSADAFKRFQMAAGSLLQPLPP